MTKCELRIANCELRITNYELRIANYELRFAELPTIKLSNYPTIQLSNQHPTSDKTRICPVQSLVDRTLGTRAMFPRD